ncbi:hypothetical protein [Dermatobacter hominis]|uniref:hypothetical protein n=1 Tax=Dermatobacter hominis TaxID=2884263 RepID=UPI001D12C11F|nr:hypothetical protein [Dermatobacter hominis]UDY36570.1 hypothetical protein LH044_03295 [Dermatobacter hominis]
MDVMDVDTETTEVADARELTTAARRRRAVRRNVALGGLVGGAAIFSSGCTLSDVSTILSILRLLGIGA